MIISHTHKYIFIKSEKTAGTSVEAALSKLCNGNDVVTPLGDFWFNRDQRGEWVHSSMNGEGFYQHDSAAEIKRKLDPEIWNAYFKFSIARNPWDRTVSLFSWEGRNNPKLTPRPRFFHKLGFPWDEFGETAKLFRKFAQGDWKTNDRFYLIGGELCVDFVIGYENLADDFVEVSRRVGLPRVDLPRLKSGMRKIGHHYAEYYDEASKVAVAERHENDIRLFGYKFAATP